MGNCAEEILHTIVKFRDTSLNTCMYALDTGAIIVFQAYRQVTFSGTGTPILYDIVPLNVGGYYDIGSGVFKAGKRGYYKFTYHSLPHRKCGTDELRTELRLHKASAALPVFVAATMSRWPNVQSHVDYLKLKIGDQVI